MTAKPKPGIVVFPASNCDRDVELVLREVFSLSPSLLWHQDDSVPKDITHIILPGGFSYGDYLRAGALASFSPIMARVKEFGAQGRPILGICNGFQVLCEAGLLPGTLLKNHHDRFVCKVVSTNFYGLRGDLFAPRPMKLPIAHGQGRYFAPPEMLKALTEEQQIILTYKDADEQGCALVNGSQACIAGIVGGPCKNIIGMMPHPERSAQSDGAQILQDFLFG